MREVDVSRDLLTSMVFVANKNNRLKITSVSTYYMKRLLLFNVTRTVIFPDRFASSRCASAFKNGSLRIFPELERALKKDRKNDL